jgi:hypothetical protein
MGVYKSGEISSNQASDVQNRAYQIKEEVSRIISGLPLRAAEELAQYCREFAAKQG